MFGLDIVTLLAAAAIGLVAGFVKGAVGFAMPMIMISGLASILPPELALATVILPTLLSNLVQAMRDGLEAALTTMRAFWRYIAIVALCILLSAQLVRILPQTVLFLVLGGVVSGLAAIQLAGLRLWIPQARRRTAEWIIGALAGGVGGLSGVWGPPTVLYLTAIGIEKRESIRVQGVVYGIGSVALLLAHLRSGILNEESVWLSAGMLLPAGLGMAAGLAVQDRLDQVRFRRATLLVLIVSGLNLVRRALV